MVRRRVTVTGRVQGVGFRFSAAQRAEELGVSGFVRNRDDGSVETEIEGRTDAVEQMLRWLRHGPRQAQVEAVDAGDIEETGERGFTVRE